MNAESTSRNQTRLDEHVSDMDTLFWRVERDPHLRNTMTAVLVFDQPPDRSVVMDRMDRASRMVPGWRHRLVSPPFNVSNPRWIADPDFDLSFHVRWIGAPSEGTLASVLEYACASTMSGLDRERPLWTVTMVEGLEGNRAAAIIKLHHVLIDGLGGIRLLPLIVDLGPEPADLGPMPPPPEYKPMSSRELYVDALVANTERFQKFVRSTGQAAVSNLPTALRDPSSVVHGMARNVKALGRLLKPASRALSPIMTERRGWWRFMPLEADLASLKRASKAHGALVNDAFLATVGYGFARYHQEQGAPIDQLRTTIAVSSRKPGDPLHGNHVLGGNFVMPVNAQDPMRHIGAYHALVEDLRHDTRQPLASASSSVVTAMGPLISGFVGTTMRHSDLLMSNIAGIDVPIWLGGARVDKLYGFGPTMGTAANATLVSYDGTAYIGLNIDASAVTDIDLLVECVQEGFDAVAAAGH